MDKFYCEYCGQEFHSVRILTASNCGYHPNGNYKGKHKLYEGSVKSRYTCKYCGQQFPNLHVLTHAKCGRHPDGNYRGYHSPAL